MKWQDAATVASIVLAVLALPGAYFVGRRTRQRPCMRYAVDHDVLVEPEDGLLAEGLSLQFEGAEIKRASRTYVAFWNDRGDTINGSDQVSTDSLRIRLASGDIALQARVRFRSREQIDIRVIPDGQEVRLPFDFLDEGDGAVIEVLHSGKTQPDLVGTIRGTAIDSAQRDAELTTAHLRKLRRGSAWIRQRMVFVARIVGVGLVFALIPSIMVVEYVIGDDERQVVDTSNFDMETVEGQVRFAQAVEQNAPDSSDLYRAALVWVTISAGIALLLGAFIRQKGMPLSVLADDVANGSPSRKPGSHNPTSRRRISVSRA
jgi:hypothetical protein